jgi:hypothetical protein
MYPQKETTVNIILTSRAELRKEIEYIDFWKQTTTLSSSITDWSSEGDRIQQRSREHVISTYNKGGEVKL